MASKDPFITTGEKLRNYVGIAFALSLLVHVIASPFFPNLAQHHSDDQIEKVSETKKIKVRVPTPPPPTPTPPPSPTPPPATPKPEVKPQHQAPKLKINQVVTHNNGGNNGPSEVTHDTTQGSTTGVVTGVASEGPPATEKPNCADPNREATVTNAMPAEYPDSARDLNLGEVVVLVEVTVGPTGNLVSSTIYKSGNNMAIDRAALHTASLSQYAPKLVNCVPTTGSYIFRVEFTPD